MPKSPRFRGPSLEEAAFSIKHTTKAPFRVHVDAHFTKENQNKLRELLRYNPKTIYERVDLSKINATLVAAKKYRSLFEALLRFYYDLSTINPDMLKFFPSYIQQADGTYLTDGKSGLHAFNDLTRKVQELRRAHDDDDLVLDLYFDRGRWKEAEINSAYKKYQAQKEAQRKKNKRRIEPTPNPHRKSPSPKSRRSPRSPTSPKRKRKRSSPAPRHRF